MTPEEQAVHAATTRFYDAIEALAIGQGVGPMKEAWHHTDRVTSGHPSGEWAHGWDEVLATWEVFASMGRRASAGGHARDLRVHVYGDVAYTTCVYQVSAELGGEALACTNVLHRVDGVWKIVHHHADKAPRLGAAFERMAREG